MGMGKEENEFDKEMPVVYPISNFQSARGERQLAKTQRIFASCLFMTQFSSFSIFAPIKLGDLSEIAELIQQGMLVPIMGPPPGKKK